VYDRVTGCSFEPVHLISDRRAFWTSVEWFEDLFEAPEEWSGAFEFVLESYTLQVLPEQERREAIGIITDFVTPGGTLLVVCRGREPEGELPWPLTAEEVRRFEDEGLDLVAFEDYADDETPPVRRFRAEFERPL